MNVFIDIDIDINIFKSDLIDIDIDIDIDIFKTCRYIDNRYSLSIYRTPLAPGEGRAGVLPAHALVRALALAGLLAPAPLVLLAVGLVPAPHHLETP